MPFTSSYWNLCQRASFRGNANTEYMTAQILMLQMCLNLGYLPHHRLDNLSLGRLIVTKSPPGDISTSSPMTQPLWIFTSSTPNTTYAHREWRPQPRTASQVTRPGELGDPTFAPRGRQRSSSLSEQHGSSSGSEEEKQPLPGPSQQPTGFLV